MIRRSRPLLVAVLATVLPGGLGVPVGSAAAAEPAAGPGLTRPSAEAIRAEIARVVQEVRDADVQTRAASAGDLARRAAAITQCAEFLAGARYCLGYGWTTSTEQSVQDELASAAGMESTTRAGLEETGDLSLQGMVERAAGMSPKERAAAARRELEDAASGVDKFIELEELRQSGAPRSEAESRSGISANAVLGGYSYPESGAILQDRVSEQTKTYWCGPATIQMMAWNWGSNAKVAQSTWASRLGTTTAGTAITDMVRVINRNAQLENWVIRQDASYVTLNIGNHTYSQWYQLNVNHYSTWRTPVVLHPILLKQYYPYLDDDASGHFQLGRGWDFRSDKTDSWQLKYYEPWNQQRFNPSEPFIPRKQTRWAKNSYLANKAHFQHNIGV